MTQTEHRFEVHVLGEHDWIAAMELCRLCEIDLPMLTELAELGVVEPRGSSPEEWVLPATDMPRLRTAGRLIRDLGVNVSGAALAVELLEAQRDMERRIRELERLLREDG